MKGPAAHLFIKPLTYTSVFHLGHQEILVWQIIVKSPPDIDVPKAPDSALLVQELQELWIVLVCQDSKSFLAHFGVGCRIPEQRYECRACVVPSGHQAWQGVRYRVYPIKE